MKCAPLQPEEIIKEVFEAAESFSAAANAVTNANHATAQLNKQFSIQEFLKFPRIVSEAFSAELYLKCLIMIQGASSPPRIHNLWELYEELSPAIKQDIKDCYEKHTSREHTAQKAKILGRSKVSSMEDNLKESSLAFEQFRYAWESNYRVRNFDLDYFRFAVRAAVLKQRPKLKGALQTMTIVSWLVKPCGPSCRGILGGCRDTSPAS